MKPTLQSPAVFTDERQRSEQPHPQTVAGIGVTLEGGCKCPRNAFGAKFCECGGARKRTRYARAKGWVMKKLEVW